jgi:TetR/AcrR family transcriptional regulator
MKEFAQQGYKNASTDNIVKEAAISKGALFHYFKNKKGLFLYLYEYALGIMKNEMLIKIDFNEKDIFKRRRGAILKKIEIGKIYPEIYEFLTTAYLDDSIDIKNDIQSTNEKLIGYAKSILYEGLDTSMFREDVDVSRAFEIINWADEGFSKKVTAQIKYKLLDQLDYDDMLREWDLYMNVLKKSFYKERT